MPEPTRDELMRRLALAERVCVLYGSTAPSGRSDRDKATTQAWMEWNRAHGLDAARPTNGEVMQLAARRDVIQNVTLVRIQQENRRRLREEWGGEDPR